MIGAVLGAATLSASLLLAFAAVSVHRRALRERERAMTVLRAARWNTDRAERHYREARRIHAHCRPSPFVVRAPLGTYPIYGRVPRGVS